MYYFSSQINKLRINCEIYYTVFLFRYFQLRLAQYNHCVYEFKHPYIILLNPFTQLIIKNNPLILYIKREQDEVFTYE